MKRAISFTVLSVIVASFVGCQSPSNSRDVSYAAVTGDLTPELQGLTERPIDYDRHLAGAMNHNLRSMSDDLSRMFLLDQPSRLAPYPVTLPSGQPR